MNLLINISNIRFGGGITVVKNILDVILPLRPQDNIFLLHPLHLGFEDYAQHTQVRLLPVPDTFHSNYFVKLYNNQFAFKQLLKKHNIDKVLSLGNVALNAGSIPQLLLVQNAYLCYPESIVWKRLPVKAYCINKLMNAYTRYNLKYARKYLLQTKVMQKHFCDWYKVPYEATYVLPNAMSPGKPVDTGIPGHPGDSSKHLLFLSKYYPHKNFELLLPLARKIKERHLPYRFTLTIDAGESPGAARFLQKVAQLQLQDIITTRGHVQAGDLEALYLQHDALFLPTLLESFSGTYTEAMHYGRPVFTSNADFARAVCGDAAWYFNPLDTEDVLLCLHKAFANPGLLQQKLGIAKQVIAQMPDWQRLGVQLSQIIDSFDACVE